MAWIAVDEARTSRRQAAWLSSQGPDLHFELKPKPSSAIRFPGAGPFDERLGYHRLPELVQRLTGQDFTVSAHVTTSRPLKGKSPFALISSTTACLVSGSSTVITLLSGLRLNARMLWAFAPDVALVVAAALLLLCLPAALRAGAWARSAFGGTRQRSP